MTREQIVALFAIRQDAIARRDVDLIAAQHAPDCEHESPLAGVTVKGREAIGQLYERWFKGFPDFVLTSEELLIDGDRVIQVTTQSGTDTGGFMELPPTGKPFRVPVVWLFTVAGQPVHARATHLRFHRHADADWCAEGKTGRLVAMTISTETRPDTAPRIMVTDTLGQRIITIDKPIVTLGRRSESDVRVRAPASPASTPRSLAEDGRVPAARLRARGSARSSTASGPTERVLAHGDRIRLGESDDTDDRLLRRRRGAVARAQRGRRRRASSATWPACSKGCARSAPAACSTTC